MSSSKPAANQRQMIILGVLGVVLLLLFVYVVLPLIGGDSSPRPVVARRPPLTATKPRSGAAGRAGTGAGGNGPAGAVEEVALARLESPWPEPIGGRRNPFSMVPDPPPPPPPPTAAQIAKQQADAAAALNAQPVGPPPPPPIPPITLKFIGMMTGPTQVGRIAALSDGKFVYHGKEGQIIEGRYRIVRIGEESIQVEYADGRGRQTIRLSGK